MGLKKYTFIMLIVSLLFFLTFVEADIQPAGYFTCNCVQRPECGGGAGYVQCEGSCTNDNEHCTCGFVLGSCNKCPCTANDGICFLYEGKCPVSCTPSCADKDCGSDGCGGQCPNTCSQYEQCQGNTCTPLSANIIAAASSVCIKTDTYLDSREVTISGKSGNCGDIEVTAPWEPLETKSQTGTGDFSYSLTFTIPENQVQKYISTREPFEFVITGARGHTYCHKTVEVSPTFLNFQYCPVPSYGGGDKDINYYLSSEDYYFYNNNIEYSWEDCATNISNKVCCGFPTDCVTVSGLCIPENETAPDNKLDNDGEIEVCYSRNNINGGWLDADMNKTKCGIVQEKTNRETKWFSCSSSDTCAEGKDDFIPFNSEDIENDVPGLCCGDDANEFPIKSMYCQYGSEDINCFLEEYEACCDASTDCVTSSGICKPTGYEYCYQQNLKAICVDSTWKLEEDSETCVNGCESCNVNNEGNSLGKVDSVDLTVIQNHYTPEHEYNAIYDTQLPKDGKVDNEDYAYCNDNYFGHSCTTTCNDGVLQETEECSINPATGAITFNTFNPNLCPASVRKEGTPKTMMRENTQCVACTCVYTEQCVKGNFGATCGNDADCSQNEKCNQDTCSCELSGCPVGQTLCKDGSCSSNCEDTDNQGCISKCGWENEVCTTDNDCCDTFKCTSGKCIKTCPIFEDFDCPNDYRRIPSKYDKYKLCPTFYKCVSGNLENEACQTTSDCYSDLVCSNNKCTPNCPSLSPPSPNFCPTGKTVSVYDEKGFCRIGYECISKPSTPNGVCEPGEGCGCADCIGQRDSCIYGAVCGTDQLCGCPLGKSLCQDGSCSANCHQTDTDNQGCIGEKNGVCEPGEGCACYDCYNKQDSCINGAVCNYYTEKCEEKCVVTENPEITLTDGKDNDCDGLIDEPEFMPGYGVYIWEANCDYYMCVYSDDSVKHNTSGTISVAGDYEFYKLKEYDWESDDTFQLSADKKQIAFNSKLKNDLDCLILKADTLIKYDLKLDNQKDRNKVYLTQRKTHPLDMPFSYSSPGCALSCNSPDECAVFTIIPPNKQGCNYDKCIFDCNGYWVNESPATELLWPNKNLGDYCLACKNNMTCSNYTNAASCVFDPCKGSLTQFGCKWNETKNKCEDAFNYCMPGTALCKDGSCSKNCQKTDWKEASCIGKPNKKCEIGEGCACSDCEDKRDSCTFGAICSEDKLCGCPLNTTLCNDLSCDTTCENHGGKRGCINKNGICEIGEGCTCEDCDFTRDSCVSEGICNSYLGKCIPTIYGNCKEGTTLCNNQLCDKTCENMGGKVGCIGSPNNICEGGEGCACEDCHNKKDSCAKGLICNADYELCDKENNEIDDEENCVDDDGDGYYKIDLACPGSDDCNDLSPEIHPGALELCNNKDDDCDGVVDDNCISDLRYALDLSIDSTTTLRVLDRVNIKVKVKNNLNKAISGININLELPDKFFVEKNADTINELGAGEQKELVYDVMIRDYEMETANFRITASVGNTGVVSKDIPVSIEIPRFLIAPMPQFSKNKGENAACYDLYYVLNDNSFSGDADIELDITKPGAVFGKSVLVDYMSSVDSSRISVRPMLSNPYCLIKGNDYEIQGYLYKAGGWKVVNTIAESSEMLTT